eukprot:8219806-Pyramimonas_sp.AAC.1
MAYYALLCSSTPCYAVLYDASRTLSGSLPCSTSDCANREEIYVIVRAVSYTHLRAHETGAYL